MKKLLTLLCTLALVLGGVGTAAALTIFQDTFDRVTNDTVGNNWTEIEFNNTGDAKVQSSSLWLLGEVATGSAPFWDNAVHHVIDTTGYENIWLDINLSGSPATEDTDFLIVSWDLSDNNWTQFLSQELGDTGIPLSLAFSPGMEDQSLLRLAFSMKADATNEAVLIHDVLVRGQVPEPATLLLLGSGLAGLGILGRRKKKFHND